MKKKINIITSFILIAVFISAIFFFSQDAQLKYLSSNKILATLVIILFMSAGIGIFSFVAPLFSKDSENIPQKNPQNSLEENKISTTSSPQAMRNDNIIVIREGGTSDFWKGFNFGIGFFFGFCFLFLIISAFFVVIGVSMFSGFSKNIGTKNLNTQLLYR